MITTRFATIDDHKAIMEVAKQSPYTRDFSNHIFSGEAMYEKNWIKIAEYKGHRGSGIVGFYCVRHKVREPATTLYFLGVESGMRSEGIGAQLIHELKQDSPHRCIQLNVMKENDRAQNFYNRHGFLVVDEALKGKAVKMELNW